MNSCISDESEELIPDDCNSDELHEELLELCSACCPMSLRRKEDRVEELLHRIRREAQRAMEFDLTKRSAKSFEKLQKELINEHKVTKNKKDRAVAKEMVGEHVQRLF